MIRGMCRALLAAAVPLTLAACDTADKAATVVQSAAQAQVNPTLSTADATFINQAGADGLAEVRLGQLAARKGAARSVRRYGQMMATDHGTLNAELAQLARSKRLTPPVTLDASSQQTYDTLSRLSARGFDRAYLEETLSSHQELLGLYQREVQNATDPEVKAFAARYLGVIQHHLDEAQRLNNVVPRRYRADAG